MDCSQETAALIDKEVQSLLESAYQQSVALLSEHRDLLDEISEYLLEKETITGDELMGFIQKKETPPAQEENE